MARARCIDEREAVTFAPSDGRPSEFVGNVPRGVTVTQELLSAVADAYDIVRRPLTDGKIYTIALSLTPVERMAQ